MSFWDILTSGQSMNCTVSTLYFMLSLVKSNLFPLFHGTQSGEYYEKMTEKRTLQLVEDMKGRHNDVRKIKLLNLPAG